MMHLRQPPRDVGDLLPDASPRLADLLTRCLAKEPRVRPSASDVIRDLSRIRAEREAYGRPGTWPSGSVGGVLEGFPAVADFLG